MITVRMWGNIYELTLDGKLYQFDTKEDLFNCLEMLLMLKRKGEQNDSQRDCRKDG